MNADVIGLQNQTVIQNAGTQEAKRELGKMEFLNLLMAQMSYQDPLSPMDNESFIQQLTSFANLEQLTNMGSQLDDLLTMTGANNAANAVSLLGKGVRVSGNEIKGPDAKIFYELPEDAFSVLVEVRNPSGEVVKIIENVPTGKGLHELEISELEEGDYTVHVVAKRKDSSEITSEISVEERVSGVNFSNSIPLLLMVSGREVAATEIVEIRQLTQ